MKAATKQYRMVAQGAKLPIQVFVSPAQKEEILQACEATGTSLAAFIREAAILRARSLNVEAKRAR